MSSFFDNLEAQLRSAARARAASASPGDVPTGRRRRRGFGWLRPATAAVPILAGVVVIVVVVGAAVVLAGHRGRGPTSQGSSSAGQRLAAIVAHTPHPQLRRELVYIATATAGAVRSKTCRVQRPAGVTYVHASPGRALLSILGVLRRPASPADRLNPEAVAGTPDVYRAYVRRASSAGRVSYYIVPARFDRAALIPSDRCFELQTAALKRALPKLPVPLRQPTRELQAAMLASYQSIAAHAPRDTICFVYLGHNEEGSGGCGIGPQAIEQGLAVQESPGTYSGVVPDGVATVTLTFPAAGGQQARSVTASVKGNVYSVPVHNPSFSPLYPTVIWRSVEGSVIKRISTPNAATARASACKHYPLACLLVQGSSGQSSSTSTSSSAP